MSADSSVTLDWAGRRIRFALPLGQVQKLEASRNLGARRILLRLLHQEEMADDIRETILFGLIGGGEVSRDEAEKLVAEHVDQYPRAVNVVPAMAVLQAHVFGNPDDKLGKKKAAKVAARATKPNA